MPLHLPPNPNAEAAAPSRQEQPAAATPAPAHPVAAWLLVLGFLAALVLPGMRTDFRGTQKTSQTENRSLNDFPAWDWNGKALDGFPAKFDAAMNDRFGFRSLLTRWHSRFKLALGVSPAEDVVLGKQGWLYYRDSVKEYRGAKAMPKKEADRWVEQLKAKQAWLAARHIRYLLVVAPNKEDVYPEYLPDNVCRLREHRFFDDILARLGTDSGVEILDLRETLRQGKRQGLVYDRTDTHWSQLGACIGMNRILERLQPWFPELHPVPLNPGGLTREVGLGGDLAHMIGLPDELQEERLVVPLSEGSFQKASLRLPVQWPAGELKEEPDVAESKPGQLTVFVTGDSFGKGLMRYLPGPFGRVVRLRPQTPYSPWFQELLPWLVEAEKPDVYLEVFCARSLKHPPAVLMGGR